ncbi:MAG TPA: hypothetical protein VFA20_09950 [Myxococcaceae bacterium]|nr:hypothetical protein [Myxococcaceae bacterium]
MTGALAALLVLLAPPEPSPELMKKLADSDARLLRLYKEGAVTMTSRVEELDKGGNVQHTQTVAMRLTVKDGAQQVEVLSAARDGQDITADERKEQAARQDPKGKTNQRQQLTLPFAAESQSSYAFQLLGPDANNPALQRIGFGPRGKKSKDLWVGEAVVDPQAGEVKWLKQRPSELPAFVDAIDMVLEFGASTSMGSAVSTVHMDGEGGLPFFKKRFRSVITFKDYVPPK